MASEPIVPKVPDDLLPEVLLAVARAIGMGCCFVGGKGGPAIKLRGERLRPHLLSNDALYVSLLLRINVEHMTTLGGKPVGLSVYPSGRGDCGLVASGASPAHYRVAVTLCAAALGGMPAALYVPV